MECAGVFLFYNYKQMHISYYANNSKSNWRRRKLYINRKKITFIIILLFFMTVVGGTIVWIAPFINGIAITTNLVEMTSMLSVNSLSKDMLLMGIPGLAYFDKKGEVTLAMAKVNLSDPKIFLNSQLSYLQLARSESAAPPTEEEIIFFERDYTLEEEVPPVEERQNKETQLQVTGEPLVAIYNSHNGETYTPTDGVPRRDGASAGVVTVAEQLALALEKQGIPTVRSEKIHDYPSYTLSYANSLKTVEEILQQHPTVEIVIDVHRDYLPTRTQTTTQVNGEDVARILFIVGNDARQSHPKWRQNLAFVNSLELKMEQLYPNLSRGVRQQDGRYNQHVHPRAMLVEMGSAENSLQEAIKSAQLLANVLAEMLAEIQSEKVQL